MTSNVNASDTNVPLSRYMPYQLDTYKYEDMPRPRPRSREKSLPMVAFSLATSSISRLSRLVIRLVIRLASSLASLLNMVLVNLVLVTTANTALHPHTAAPAAIHT
jgi:hypothetical protein